MNERSILERIGLGDEFDMIWEQTFKVIARRGYELKHPPGDPSAKLGEGAFAAVFYAEHVQDKTPVAVKVFRDEGDTTLASFRKEVARLRALDFPKEVATVAYDSWHEPGTQPLIVMEYVRGLPIHEHCAQRRLSRPARLKLLEDAFRALQVVHDRGVAHRDVSVSNILIDNRERPRIIDFGLSAEIQKTMMWSTVPGRGAVAPGEVKYGNKRPDAQDDVFECGMVGICVVTDHAPPENITSSGDPKHLDACRRLLKASGADRTLTDLLLRALQTPELRYKTPQDLANALFDYRVLAPARRKTRRLIVAGICLFPCFGYGGWWLYAETQQDRLAAEYEGLKKEAEQLENAQCPPVARLISYAEKKRGEWDTLYRQGKLDSAFPALGEGIAALRRAIDVSPIATAFDLVRNAVEDVKWAERDYGAVQPRREEFKKNCLKVEKLLTGDELKAVDNSRQSVKELQEQLRQLRTVNDVVKLRGDFEDRFQAEVPDSLRGLRQVREDIVETKQSADACFGVAQTNEEWENTRKLYAVAGQSLDEFVRPTNSIGMQLRLILPGSFQMGSSKEEAEAFVKDLGADATYVEREVESHPVKIEEPFWLGIHEVTKGQFRQFVKETGYKTEAEKDDAGVWVWDGYNTVLKKGLNWDHPDFPQDDRHPVVCVSYNDAIEFCKWLSAKEKEPYDLPKEKQWEYACRAGTKTRFPFGIDVQELPTYGNAADATLKEKLGWDGHIRGHDGHVYTAPVGSFKPNDWGLYDMLGNVWEWVKDGYVDYPKSTGEQTSPADNKQEAQQSRVIRGGGWATTASTAGRPIAAGTRPGGGTATWAFAWPEVCRASEPSLPK